MGTDIHGVFQRHDGSRWVDCEMNLELDRHYLLFAILAGVRNGHGFAGVPTHTPLVPISQPRGLPDDFEMSDEHHPLATAEASTPWRRPYIEIDGPKVWMGDHSHSWLLDDEILAAKVPAIQRTGVVTIDEFKQWDGHSAPNSWCGGISGRGVVVSESNAVRPNTTHVRIYWGEEPADSIAYFTDEVRRLKEKYGRVRFVFGFDS